MAEFILSLIHILLQLVGASVKQDRANMLKWFTRSGISIDADGIEMLEGAWWQGRDIDYATLLNLSLIHI